MNHRYRLAASRPRYNPHHPQQPPQFLDPNYHHPNPPFNNNSHTHFVEHFADSPHPYPPPRVSNPNINPYLNPSSSHYHDAPFNRDPWAPHRDLGPPRFEFFDEDGERRRLPPSPYGGNIRRFSNPNPNPNPNLDSLGERSAPWPQDLEFRDRIGRRSVESNSFGDYPMKPRSYDRGDSSYSDRYRDEFYNVDGRGRRDGFLHLPESSRHSYIGRDRELFESRIDVYCDVEGNDWDYGFDDGFSMDENRRKRRLLSGGDEFGEQCSPARRHAKRSALSRIQSDVSVWNRIEEKPSYLSSSAAPVSVHAVSNEQQLQVDSVEIAFKNTSVAKVGDPSSPGVPSSNGKTPDVVAGNKSTPKKKLIKKKKRVVVPVITGSLGSDKKDEDTNRKISSTPEAILNNSEELEAPLTCIKSSGLSSPQTYSKMITKEERSPKSDITKEEEQKTFTTTCFEAKVGSETSSRDLTLQFTFPETVVETGPAQQTATSNLMGDSSINDNLQKDESRLEQYAVQHHANYFRDTADAKNDSSQSYPEEKNEVSLYIDPADQLLSSDAPYRSNFDQVHNNLEMHMDNGEDSESFGDAFAPSTSLVVTSDNQVIMPVLCHSDTTCDNSVICNNIEDKIHNDGEPQIFRDTVSKGLEAGNSVETEAGDATSFLETKDVPLAVEIKNLSLDQDISGKTIDGAEDSLGLNVCDEPQVTGCLRHDNENLTPFLVNKELLCMPSVNNSIVVSDVQETIHHSGAEPCLDEWPGTYSCVDNNGRDYKKRRIDVEETASLTKRDLFVSEPQELIKPEINIPHDQPTIEPEKRITSNPNAIECIKPKNFQSSVIPKVLSSQASLGGSLQGLSRSASNPRNSTWHRKSSLPSVTLSNGALRSTKSTPSSKLSPRKFGKSQTSYVRKGNSLIRKTTADLPPRPSHVPFASSMNHVPKESVQLDFKGEASSRLASLYHTVERPKTPPLPFEFNSGSPIPDSPTNVSLASETPIAEGGTSVPTEAVGLNFQKSNNQTAMTFQVSEPSKNKKMMYVKRKLNQLVAASQLKTNLPNHYVEKTRTSSFTSDLYYKRKKNQLIRSASSDNLHKQDSVPADDRNSEIKKVPSVVTKKGNLSDFPKKRLNKVRHKANKHVTFSNVWTLSGDGKSSKVLDYRKVLPLFPWKRVFCWTGTSSLLKKHSLSSARRKIFLPKVGARRSLKWSRPTTGRRSKTITKEAKSSANEVERKRTERKTSSSAYGNERRRKSISCERIYRVGSARYKMDALRRTLIRLSDDESPTTTTTKTSVKGSSNSSQTSIVPKRLQIGHEEYIRMGSGNQLIRNPKKIVRILANEKVRWSLHTARMRLARKQNYCQFFTRFGECNKKGGRCPYIHDPDKVAICTKFLRGSCSNTTCKLTHKIIPERMPDCSYFLQGLCTNTCCPYRHVNVNSNAAICDGFLKGYCADGDECLKKHSYICPVFEASGKCPQGSKCKLHHPKSRSKSKNRNRLMVQSNSWGRYFGSGVCEVAEPLVAYSGRQAMEKVDENHISHGGFAEYIGLDFDGQSSMDVDVALESHQIYLESDESDLEDDNLDGLTKPIRIMKMNTITSTDA